MYNPIKIKGLEFEGLPHSTIHSKQQSPQLVLKTSQLRIFFSLQVFSKKNSLFLFPHSKFTLDKEKKNTNKYKNCGSKTSIPKPRLTVIFGGCRNRTAFIML